jgi:hypothetical protein
MQGTLSKPWGKHPAGTLVVTVDESVPVEPHIRVTKERFDRLTEESSLEPEDNWSEVLLHGDPGAAPPEGVMTVNDGDVRYLGEATERDPEEATQEAPLLRDAIARSESGKKGTK